LKTIAKAEDFHKQNVKRFYIPVMAQILRERSPIRKEDFVATILSESPETISIVMSVLPEDTQQSIYQAALEMMKKASDQGYIDNHYKEKLSALEGGNN
jgi:hypothetical protein